MIITSVTNPVYSKADNSAIDALVTFDTIGTPVPFTCHSTDSTEYSVQL